ncbi:MAG: hypothetical protein AAF146_18095 [Bacteroidota bacterium]
MKTPGLLLILLPCVLPFLCGSCAGVYKELQPNRLNYPSPKLEEGISFGYKYDVLKLRLNKKYAKKELKYNVRLVAVKLENNSDRSYTFGQDLLVTIGNNDVGLMDPEMIFGAIKQKPPLHLLYLLLTPARLTVSSGNTTNNFPLGLLLGPGLALGNMLTASASNKKLLQELKEQNLLGRSIGPGETVYGLIGFRDIGYESLSLQRSE